MSKPRMLYFINPHDKWSTESTDRRVICQTPYEHHSIQCKLKFRFLLEPLSFQIRIARSVTALAPNVGGNYQNLTIMIVSIDKILKI